MADRLRLRSSTSAAARGRAPSTLPTTLGGCAVTDDPREVLKAAGVECAEVGEYMACLDEDREMEDLDNPQYVFTALARLVAKYKWGGDSTQAELLQAALARGSIIPALAAGLGEYEGGHS